MTFTKGQKSDVAYSLFEGDAHLDSVISFNSHHTLHRRQSGNDNTTSSPTPTGGTTPEFTEQEVSQNHKYYTSTVLRGAADFNSYWDELYDVKHSEPLSGSHRVAVSVPINFNFRFYGHDVSKITIATGGFLYMSPFLHQWLTATQYIAPLMANFDTTLGNESQVLYKDFGHKFVVEWRDIFLQDQNHTEPFSFQTTLHSNGTIYFAYKQIPVEIQSIEKKNHPVKVGVSDAFYIDTIYAVKSQNGSQHRYSDSNEDETERKARMQKVAMNRQMKQKHPQVGEIIIKQEPVSISIEATSSMPDTQSGGDEKTTFPTVAFGNSQPLILPTLTPDTVPKDPKMYRILKTEEKMLVEELSVAYVETLGGFANETHVNKEESYSSADELVNNSEIAVRRLIKFVKKIAQFRGMSQENQVACLKSCVLNALLLRSVNFYDAENDAWKTPTGSIPTSVLKHATGFNDLHDAHTSYCAGLKKLTRDDSNIMALIQTITVFNPDGQNLENRQTISDIQDQFIQLLRHYLESEYDFFSHFSVLLTRRLNEGVQRRTIYEYHRVEVDFTRIQSNSVVILEPLTTCNIAKDCFTCLSQDDNFDCKWCQKVRRCSDGIDWLRQEWRDQGCEIQGFDQLSRCGMTSTSSVPWTTKRPTDSIQPDCSSSRSNCSYRESQKGASNATIAGVVVAVLILVLLIVGGVWFFYAYTHPTSASGQWMINHRPSEMKAKMNKMKFWKRDTASGEKYRVESTA
uniref:Plexin domain-containing protein 2 n=1 Tax=Magallana gigas TaxID=29159 RepID=K1R4B8_MAGGI